MVFLGTKQIRLPSYCLIGISRETLKTNEGKAILDHTNRESQPISEFPDVSSLQIQSSLNKGEADPTRKSHTLWHQWVLLSSFLPSFSREPYGLLLVYLYTGEGEPQLRICLYQIGL